MIYGLLLASVSYSQHGKSLYHDINCLIKSGFLLTWHRNNWATRLSTVQWGNFEGENFREWGEWVENRIFAEKTFMKTSPVSLPKDATPPASQRKLLQIATKTQNSQSFRPPKFPTIWYKLATAVLALCLLVYIYIQKNRNMLKLLLLLIITCSGVYSLYTILKFNGLFCARGGSTVTTYIMHLI